jgi:hypothetical protein
VGAWIGSAGYQTRIILHRGARFGLNSLDDILRLGLSWRSERRLFEPYEILVIERVSSTLHYAPFLVLPTIVMVAQHFENRVILKLWRVARVHRTSGSPAAREAGPESCATPIHVGQDAVDPSSLRS